jgi:hypothetical protein
VQWWADGTAPSANETEKARTSGVSPRSSRNPASPGARSRGRPSD